MDKSSPEYRKYQRYLTSGTWRRKKARKLKQVGYRCQACKSVHNLECHHLTYERLYHERLSDLAIYCHDCHEKADKIRAFEAGLKTYAVKRWGENWQDVVSKSRAIEEFKTWLKSKGPNL